MPLLQKYDSKGPDRLSRAYFPYTVIIIFYYPILKRVSKKT